MPLNRMTLQAMARLADDIDAVRAAMAILEDRGLVALACLEPGRPMAIELVREMPEIGYQPDPFERVSIAEAFRDAPVQRPDLEGAGVPLWQEMGLDRDPGGTIQVVAVVSPQPEPITAEAPPSGAESAADAGGQAAPEPAVTGAGEADRPAAPAPQSEKAAGWTDEDTDRLILYVAADMEQGLSLRQAALLAAPFLKRPPEGTYMKARSLVERIEAARTAMLAAQVAADDSHEIPAGPPDDLPQEAGAPDAGQASEGPGVAEGDAMTPDDATAGGVAGPSAPLPDPAASDGALTPFGEMLAYLQGLPRKRGWTVQRDHDLLHFAQLGWKTGEIALELAILADEIKPRFAMLTRQGQYKRAEVLDGLAALLAAEAGQTAAETAAQTAA